VTSPVKRTPHVLGARHHRLCRSRHSDCGARLSGTVGPDPQAVRAGGGCQMMRVIDPSGRGHLNCPRCGLSIEARPQRAPIRHCPRCVGRGRVIVELFSSTLPADLLYDERSLPRADGEPEPA